MLTLTPQMRILVAVEPVDFRRGIDGLAGLCRQALREDPFSGCVFVFRNRRATAIKVLVYDGQGFWLCQKRLSQGRFDWWPTRERSGEGAVASAAALVRELDARDLQLMMWNGNPRRASMQPLWRSLRAGAGAHGEER